MTRKLFANVMLLGAASLPASWGQSLPASLDFTRSSAEGFHIYNISTFSSYTAYDIPQTVGQTASATSYSRKTFGLLGTVGWQRFRGHTAFSLRYTASYSGDIPDTSANRLNHNFSFNLSRTFGTKWTVNFTAYALRSTFDRFVFNQTGLGTLAQTPATFDDLAASMSVGQFSGSQSSVLLSSQPPTSAIPAVLLGSQVLMYSTRAEVSYAPTTRLTFRFGGFGVGGQHSSKNADSGFTGYSIPSYVSADATATFSAGYLLSPRTQISFDVGQTYIRTRVQRSTATNGSVSLGRKMGHNWFVRGYIGGAYVEGQSGLTSAPVYTTGGASLGVTTHGNTFLASYSRFAYDFNVNPGALGANTALSGAWNWRRPRNNWGVYAGYSRIRNGGGSISALSGWQANAGFTERLPGNLFLTVNYTHLNSLGAFLNVRNSIQLDGVRVMLGWAPHGSFRSRGGMNSPSLNDPDDH